MTLAERGEGAAAAGSAGLRQKAVVKAEPLEEEQESSAEEDAGVSSASRLAARFGAPKARGCAADGCYEAKAKSTPKAKAAAAPAAAASRSEKPGPPEAKPKAASRLEGPALRPLRRRRPTCRQSPRHFSVGRPGERLKLSLRKQLDDIIRDLETTTLAQLDDPKERKRRAKVLTQEIASLKSQTKRLQESANRAALQEEEDELSEVSDVATAAHRVFSAANCANPDSEQLTKACALLRASASTSRWIRAFMQKRSRPKRPELPF